MALRPIKGEVGCFLDTVSGEVLDISDYREDAEYEQYGSTYSDRASQLNARFLRDMRILVTRLVTETIHEAARRGFALDKKKKRK